MFPIIHENEPKYMYKYIIRSIGITTFKRLSYVIVAKFCTTTMKNYVTCILLFIANCTIAMPFP